MEAVSDGLTRTQNAAVEIDVVCGRSRLSVLEL